MLIVRVVCITYFISLLCLQATCLLHISYRFPSSKSFHRRNYFERHLKLKSSLFLKGTKTDATSTSYSKAKNINYMITKYFSSQFNTTSVNEEKQKFQTYLKRNVGNMNSLNAVTLMHRCSKRKVNIFEYITYSQLVKLIESRFKLLFCYYFIIILL